jgi:hypothetical protein
VDARLRGMMEGEELAVVDVLAWMDVTRYNFTVL